jgi:hypothetical protein
VVRGRGSLRSDTSRIDVDRARRGDGDRATDRDARQRKGAAEAHVPQKPSEAVGVGRIEVVGQYTGVTGGEFGELGVGNGLYGRQ